MTSSPHVLVRTQFNELLTHLPGVRSADVEAVHQARVATRRLRELIPLLRGADSGALKRARASLRAAGRALGETRQLDVTEALLATLEPRARFAARMLSSARRRLDENLERARRNMIKTIEDLQIERLERVFVVPHQWQQIPAHLMLSAGWTKPLSLQLRQRAEDMRRAVRHASGVYFPNRLHAARVAVKKLKYSVEAVIDTGFWRPPHLLKDLKQAQAILGDIHDLQVLQDALDGPLSDGSHAEERAWFTDLIRAEIGDRHRDYLRDCDRLEAAGTACERFSSRVMTRRSWRAGSVLVSALVVPSGLFLLRRNALRAPAA